MSFAFRIIISKVQIVLACRVGRMFQFAQLGSLNDPNAKFGRFLAVMNFRDFLHMSASRPNAGHSCGRRTILKRAVRAAKLSRRLSVHAKHPLYRTQTARGSRQLIAVNRRSERLQFVESGHRKRKLRPQARYGQFARCAVLTRTASQNNATIRYLGCPLATLPAGSIAPSDWPKKLFRSTENRRVRSPGQVVPLLHILLASCRAIGGISPIRTLRRDFLKNAGIKDSQKSRKIVNSLFTN